MGASEGLATMMVYLGELMGQEQVPRTGYAKGIMYVLTRRDIQEAVERRPNPSAAIRDLPEGHQVEDYVRLYSALLSKVKPLHDAHGHEGHYGDYIMATQRTDIEEDEIPRWVGPTTYISGTTRNNPVKREEKDSIVMMVTMEDVEEVYSRWKRKKNESANTEEHNPMTPEYGRRTQSDYSRTPVTDGEVSKNTNNANMIIDREETPKKDRRTPRRMVRQYYKEPTLQDLLS